MRSLLRLRSALPIALCLVLASGCGDSKGNDQGVSFGFRSWAPMSATAITCPPPQSITTLIVPLSGSFGSQTALPDDETGGGVNFQANSGSAGGAAFLTMVLDNYLSKEAIRVDRAFHSYFIPGASVQPPDTSVGVSATLGPGVTLGDEFQSDSTLPDGFSTIGSTTCANVPIITADIRTFLNLNRSSFPEPPFVMVVETYASGVTTSGTRLDTNPIQLEVLVTTDNVIPPTEGTATGGTTTTGPAFADGSGSLGSSDGVDGEIGDEDMEQLGETSDVELSE